MTEDFLKIKDAMEALKGDFKGVIIKAGDLKSGTKDGKDWTKKVFTIGDDSGSVDLVAWGDEIKQFEVGKLYEFVKPWWKTYEGKVSVQVGKYGSAKFITGSIPDTPPPPKEQTVVESGSQSAPKPDSPQITQSKGRTDEPNESKIEKLTDIELGTVEDATKKLLSISLAVGEEVRKVTLEPNPLFVMEATKIIYDKFFASNFKKASDTR